MFQFKVLPQKFYKIIISIFHFTILHFKNHRNHGSKHSHHSRSVKARVSGSENLGTIICCENYFSTEIQNYDIDGPNNDGASVAEKNRAILAAAARRRDAGHNERYYDEVGLRFISDLIDFSLGGARAQGPKTISSP